MFLKTKYLSLRGKCSAKKKTREKCSGTFFFLFLYQFCLRILTFSLVKITCMTFFYGSYWSIHTLYSSNSRYMLIDILSLGEPRNCISHLCWVKRYSQLVWDQVKVFGKEIKLGLYVSGFSILTLSISSLKTATIWSLRDNLSSF